MKLWNSSRDKELFNSFFGGGFECSTHRRNDGTRLDLIASTGHDRFADADYLRLRGSGMDFCRDGFRWHLIESRPGFYDFASVRPLIAASRRVGIQVIWDLLHYGWPDWLDVFSPQFVTAFAAFCRASARLLASECEDAPWIAVVNEPSFLCWAAGEVAFVSPCARGRGEELKLQLIRAAIAGIEAIREVSPSARFLQVDPLIHIVPADGCSELKREEAEGYQRAQFDCWDMMAGYLRPELGGHPSYLDVVGCNYYPYNQWIFQGPALQRTDPEYRPLSDMLVELFRRYKRPILISETGTEDEARPHWLQYVASEARSAMLHGAQIEGICLYPVVNHPGWDDDRHCQNGLWDYCNDHGHREIYIPLANEVSKQAALTGQIRELLARECAEAAVSV